MANYSIAATDLTQLMAKTIEAGASLSEILQQLHMPQDLFEQAHGLVTVEDAWRIIIANQNAIHEESLLTSSRPLRQGTTRLVFSSLHDCHTLEDGLRSLAENYNIIHGGQFNSVHKHGNRIFYRVDDRDFHYLGQPSPLAIEFALIRIHCALSSLKGSVLKLSSMSTKRSQLPSHCHHLLLFNTEIKAGQACYELSYHLSQDTFFDQASSNIDLSENCYNHYLSLLKQGREQDDDVVLQCLSKIRQHSSQYDIANQEFIAAKLNTSVASLRRKLSQSGTSFRQLLDKVNSESAIDMIHSGLDLHSIASALGYSDERSFKRAFKRWYQLSPTEYIRNHADNL